MRSFATKLSVNKTEVTDVLFKPDTQHKLPQKKPSATTAKCYQLIEKVVPNISQVKFTKKEVEDHHRISSISKKTKSVTACNDSSNSRTSNANAVCAECGKCVFNSNHDACVSRYLKDVNARTKKPRIVPISASKPKRKANKSVATPHKKTVASDTTIQKSKSTIKKLTQKPLRTKKIWMPKVRKDDESTSVSPTIDIVSRITNILKISNFIGSNLSNIPSSSNSLADCTTHPIHCCTSVWHKHMWQSKALCNFVEKFLGTVRFGNDQLLLILVYGDRFKEMKSTYCFVRRFFRERLTITGLVPQGQKGSDYDNSDPVPPRQNVVPTAKKTDSSHQGLEFSLQSLLEEDTIPTHDQAEENNNDQAPNASFQEAEFINPFCA
ncbi:hypothetical protein Tco_0988562 [Tanacetum coccineum]|uniref:Uncharacterized protein n=1 Tax=Tanacetum coccineum TaxID=301880 RepID=A0ABQ5ES13_9ASTR